MARVMNIRRRDACLFLATAFAWRFTGHQLTAAITTTPPSRRLEERGPPTKVELGQAG